MYRLKGVRFPRLFLVVCVLGVAAAGACGEGSDLAAGVPVTTARPAWSAEQQADLDEVERLLADEIPQEALGNLAGTWIEDDGKVVVAFAGDDGIEKAQADERLEALLNHRAVVLVGRRFSSRELDEVMERAAEVLNRTVASKAQAEGDGWPWGGAVDVRRNIVSVTVDRDLYRRYKAEVEAALQRHVDTGALEIEASEPFREQAVNAK